MAAPGTITNFASFEAALRRGLGRAVLFLREQKDTTAYREIILEACAHNWAYDRQTEDHRALYMFDIIQATGELEFYAERIREFLKSPEEEYSVRQVLDLNVMLAKNGDQHARQAVYDAYTSNKDTWYTTDSLPLVELDGIDGYLLAVRQLSRYPISDQDSWEEDAWEDISLFDDALKLCGKKKLRLAISQASIKMPKIAEYVNCVRRLRIKRTDDRIKRHRAHSFIVTYEDIQRLILDPVPKWSGLRRCGRFADEETINHVALDLLSATDRDILWKLLRVFSYREFPLDHYPILLLARSEDQEIAVAAREALGNVSHPAVRELALELRATGVPPWESVDLLAHNYKEGDYRLIEEIAAGGYSVDDFHRLFVHIRDFTKANPEPAARTILNMLYETGYCSWCRCGVIERLLAVGPLPDWMIAECRYDAYDGTRELIAELESAAPE